MTTKKKKENEIKDDTKEEEEEEEKEEKEALILMKLLQLKRSAHNEEESKCDDRMDNNNNDNEPSGSPLQSAEDLPLLLQLLLLLQTQKENDESHEIPYLSPKAIAETLNRYELLSDIKSGLTYIQCIGLIDVINQVLTEMTNGGYINVRKKDKETWIEYINNLSIYSPQLSFLDVIAFGVETGYRIIIKCKCYESNDCHLDIFKCLDIYLSAMVPVIITCKICKPHFVANGNDSDNNNVIKLNERNLTKWNSDLKFKLLNMLYLKCMTLKQMTPKDNIKSGTDLPTDIILSELQRINDNQTFLDVSKLSNDINQYEFCKKHESKLIKTATINDSDWKDTDKEICQFTKKDVTKWINLWQNQSQSVKKEYYFELVAVLCQTVKLCNGWYPRHTQIIPMLISIEYEYKYYNVDNKSKGILFEIGTGEGKSVVVMLMAAMQKLLFNRYVDIATSQKLLAEREAEETEEYFKILNLGSNGAEYINADGQEDSDEQKRRDQYKTPIIYSTPYNYQCDLLHENSGKDDEIDCRDGRLFQVNIVDEVDNAFKDLALNSTQLSSPTPGWRDINNILFLIFQRMKLTIISLGMPFVIEDTLYFMPNTDENNNNDIVKQYENSILSSMEKPSDIGTIIANQIISYCLNNKQESILFLKQYKLISNSNLNYNSLKQSINHIRYKNRKLFLQLISHEFIFNVNTLVLSQRKDANDATHSDFYCYFQDGKLITDNIPLSDFNGTIVVSGPSSSSKKKSIIDWNNLKSIIPMKNDSDSYEKLIKKNVYENVSDYVSEIYLPSFVNSVVYERLNKWIDSCWRSLFYISEGRDYIINNNEVCVVDYSNTGCIQPKMHWSDGLHEFVQIKHGLKMSTIGTAANIMTNSFYFNLFHHTYGLTGTLGGDKLLKYYKNCFGVDYLRIPSFIKKANLRSNNVYCNNYMEWIQMILLSTYSKLQKGCAVLIIAEHIHEVQNIAKQLDNNNKKYNNAMKKCKMYSRDDTNEKKSVSVKLDIGDVIVATNLAGRGTDIKLTKKVNTNGGLHVILTFLPSNIRIEKQALGRTARAGNPGSSIIIINKQNCKYAMNDIPQQNIPKLRDFLADKSVEALQERVNSQKNIERFYRKFLENFCPDIKNRYYLTTHDKDQIYYKWSMVYVTMDKDMSDSQLCSKYNDFVNNVYSK